MARPARKTRRLLRVTRRPALRRAFALGLLVLLALQQWQQATPVQPAPVPATVAAAPAASPAVLPDACRLQGPARTVTVSRVIDGDTVELADRQRVRLIGLNTPETRAADPAVAAHAAAARQRLQALLADGPVQLQEGTDAHDHYRRLLADLFTAGGEQVAATLVRDGLAFAAYFPPNLAYAACIAAAEREAREAGRGVWSLAAFAPLQAAHMGAAAAGFQRLQGRVLRIDASSQALWVQFEGDAVLQLPKKHLALFAHDPPEHWPGRHIEATGWLVDRQQDRRASTRGHARWMMQVRHPAAVRLLTKP